MDHLTARRHVSAIASYLNDYQGENRRSELFTELGEYACKLLDACLAENYDQAEEARMSIDLHYIER